MKRRNFLTFLVALTPIPFFLKKKKKNKVPTASYSTKTTYEEPQERLVLRHVNKDTWIKWEDQKVGDFVSYHKQHDKIGHVTEPIDGQIYKVIGEPKYCDDGLPNDINEWIHLRACDGFCIMPKFVYTEKYPMLLTPKEDKI